MRGKFKDSSHGGTHCAHREGRKDAKKMSALRRKSRRGTHCAHTGGIYAEAIEEAAMRAEWAARREALRRALAP